MRLAAALALVARLLARVTRVREGDAALALPQGFFGAQHPCLFPSVVSVSLVTARAAARAQQQQRADRRALVTALSLLAASHRFDFCAFFASFWRDALLAPVAALLADGRSFVSLNRCVTFVDELRFMLTLPHAALTQAHFDQLREFLSAKDADVLDTEDLAALTAQDMHTRRPVAVKLTLDVSSTVLQAAAIEGIRQVFTEYAELPERHRRDCSLRFQPMMLWCDQVRVSDPAVWEALTALVLSPLGMPAIVLFYSQIKSSARHLDEFRKFIHRTVLVQTSGQASSLRSLNFTGTELSFDQAISIFSAIWYPNGLQDLILEHYCEVNCQHRMLWVWIVLAAFHPMSKSTLRHLNLSQFHFRDVDLPFQQRVLESTCPVRAVFWARPVPIAYVQDMQFLPSGHRRIVKCSRGTVMRRIPHPRSSVVLVIKDSSFEYEAGYVGFVWLCLLAPGYGFAWVRADSIESYYDIIPPAAESDAPPPPIPRRQLQAFTYRDVSSEGNVIAVVRMLGDALETLDIENSHVRGDELAEILRLFPRLHTLNFRAPTDLGLTPLVEHFQNRNCAGQCALETLEISVQSAEEIHQLAQVLGDRSGKIISRIHLYVKRNEAKSALCEIANVLVSNRTLVYLGIFTKLDESVSALFKEEHGKLLRLNISMKSKLAMLSVIQHEESKLRPVRLLDAGVLSLIFKFASVPVRREIHIFDEYDE